MEKIIGICGYISSGSSAISDLLKEFDNVCVLDNIEFLFPYFPDGIEDLEYHVNNHHKYFHSVIAIDRFRKLMKWSYLSKAADKNFNKIVNEYVNEIIQMSWIGRSMADQLIMSRIKKKLFILFKKIFKLLKIKKVPKIIKKCFFYKMELSIIPQNFDIASKIFINKILDSMGRKPDKITVLDQPFEGCDPIKSYKYFNDPKAVIVNRDPRDHYLFVKNFLQPRGLGHQIPCENADEYIKYYRLARQCPPGLDERDDILFMNFEELIYDYENAVPKVADFCGVAEHVRKGEFFKPTHSASNTQLFRKYTEYKNDIVKIETELGEYLFDFDKYSSIEPEGGMFWGNQGRKRR